MHVADDAASHAPNRSGSRSRSRAMNACRNASWTMSSTSSARPHNRAARALAASEGRSTSSPNAPASPARARRTRSPSQMSTPISVSQASPVTPERLAPDGSGPLNPRRSTHRPGRPACHRDHTQRYSEATRIAVLCTGCLVASRARCSPSVTATVQSGAMSLISRRAALPRPALARAPVLVRRAADAAIAGRDTTDPRYPDPQPGIASSFGLLAGPRGGASAAADACSWAWSRSHPTNGRSRRAPEVRSLSPQEIPRSGRHGGKFRTAPGATWCRLCVRMPGDAELSASSSGSCFAGASNRLPLVLIVPEWAGCAGGGIIRSSVATRYQLGLAPPCWIGHRAAQRADAPRDLSVGHERGQAGGQVGGERSVAAGRVVDAPPGKR